MFHLQLFHLYVLNLYILHITCRAGLVNLITTKKGTPVIEFIDPDNINVCYMRLSSLSGHRYYGVPVISGVADVETLQLTFDQLH